MKITEITASRTARINLGDYESTDVFMSMKAEVEDGDLVAEVRKSLLQTLERAMTMQVVAAYKARGKDMTKDQVIRKFGFGNA